MIDKLLGALFPARTLAGLTEPRRVSLYGVIASENTLVAPISGFRGAAIELAVFARIVRVTTRGEQTEHIELVMARTNLPKVLLVACPGGVLEVSAGHARFEFPGAGYGPPLDRPPPPEFAPALEHEGVLHARESILAKGHRVHVRGTVIPGARLGESTDYRTLAETPMFTAREVIISDRSLG